MVATLLPSDEHPRIEALISALIEDADLNRPVPRPGFVLTLLWPCDFYELPEDRTIALRDYALASSTSRYFVKLLYEGWHYEAPADLASTTEKLIPESDDPEAAVHAFMANVERTWPRRPIDRYWWGEWSVAEGVPDHSDFMEHILLDEGGAWAILLSDDDHGWLVSDVATAQALLSAWRTTAEAEIERYIQDAADGRPDAWRARLVKHALERLWT